jgi:acyl dehydratase
MIEIDGIAGLRELLGTTLGPSGWRTVTQADIDDFARVSGDYQWIHVDPARAATETPFGKTILHGNLTLSMADGFRTELMRLDGIAMGLNYGWNKVRFPAPVPVDSRIRAGAEIVSLEQKAGGWWEFISRFVVEVEGAEKPAFVGDSVVRLLPV